MRALGQWNTAWDPFYSLDPVWTEEFFATAIEVYASGVMPPKELELLGVAFDASYTHMYAPGTRRHIKAALKAGATIEEIMEVLKLCVVQGVQACNLGVPILAEELTYRKRVASTCWIGLAGDGCYSARRRLISGRTSSVIVPEWMYSSRAVSRRCINSRMVSLGRPTSETRACLPWAASAARRIGGISPIVI